VAHTYNPSYSGGRDQEDCSSKSLGKYSARPYLKKNFTKIGLVEWLKVKALSSSPSTENKKTNIRQVYKNIFHQNKYISLYHSHLAFMFSVKC
jgi:hypothetical protein